MMTCEKLDRKKICQSLTDLIESLFELYLSISLTHFRGNFLDKNSDIGVDHFTMKGVVKVVTADTATTVGYKKSLVTPSDMPSVAMMNENSPICDKLIPVCTDCLSGWPESKAPTVALSD